MSSNSPTKQIDEADQLTETAMVRLEQPLHAAIKSLADGAEMKMGGVIRAILRLAAPAFKAQAEALKGEAVSAELIMLNPELDREVEQASKAAGCSRSRLLLETVRVGVQEAYWKMDEERLEKIIRDNPEGSEAARTARGDLGMLKHFRRMSDPKEMQLHLARSHEGAVNLQLYSLLQNVPDAKEWFDLRMKHWQLTRFWVQISDLPIERLRAMVAQEELKQAQQKDAGISKPAAAKKHRKSMK
jgi:hypothetical protein